MIRWYWVSLPYATFGIGFRDGIVVETADINRWMMGKGSAEIGRWLGRKNATVTVLGIIRRGGEPW